MARNNRWSRLNVAFDLFRAYVHGKRKPYQLSVLDLLYASNFKGGNASVCEPLSSLVTRLLPYSTLLNEIDANFGMLQLRKLTKSQLGELKRLAASFLALTLVPELKIDGFGPAYASAVLCAHFPDLLPVIDKWVLNGAGIATAVKKKPIEGMEQYYGDLLEKFWIRLKKHPNRTLREQDEKWYTS